MAAKTAEARSEAARKAWATRRSRALQKLGDLCGRVADFLEQGNDLPVPDLFGDVPEKTAAQRNAEARAKDWAKLAAWIDASEHRRMLLEAVVRLNKHGKYPSQKQAMARAWRPYSVPSHKSNGSQAIRDLITAGLLVNIGAPKGHRLQVDWEFLGVLSDWQEENGLPRLDVRLRDQGTHIFRKVDW